MAGDDRGRVVAFCVRGIGHVEPQFGLAGFFIEAVALEAVFGEDRADVAVEIELLLGGWGEPLANANGQ